MGAIVKRSIVTIDDAIRFSHYNAEECDYVNLSIVLESIKEKADYICQNKFILRKNDEYIGTAPILDDDGEEQPIPIPMGVESWILRRFAREVNNIMSGNNKTNDAEIGSVELDPKDWNELRPYINTINHAQSIQTQVSQSNLSYRVCDPDGDYFIY